MILGSNVTLRPECSLTLPYWEILSHLWDNFKTPTLTLSSTPDEWIIQESLYTIPYFELHRNKLSMQRIESINVLGLLGTSLINPKDTSCMICEGVSDYMTLKLLFPSNNVLGVTQLGGSAKARQFILSMFDKVAIIGDNDSSGARGIDKWRTAITSHGKRVKVLSVPRMFKDVSEWALDTMKCNEINKHDYE